MAGSAMELLLKSHHLPFPNEDEPFHNIKVMLMKMKDQFPLIYFLMIHHENEASLGIAEVKV